MTKEVRTDKNIGSTQPSRRKIKGNCRIPNRSDRVYYVALLPSRQLSKWMTFHTRYLPSFWVNWNRMVKLTASGIYVKNLTVANARPYRGDECNETKIEKRSGKLTYSCWKNSYWNTYKRGKCSSWKSFKQGGCWLNFWCLRIQETYQYRKQTEIFSSGIRLYPVARRTLKILNRHPISSTFPTENGKLWPCMICTSKVICCLFIWTVS